MSWLQAGVYVALGGWAAWGLLLLLSQRRLVFQPGNHSLTLPSRLLRRSEQVALTTSSGKITGWFLHASEHDTPSEQAYLFLPGSIGNVSHEVVSLEFLLSTGIDVFTIDYPGYGQSGGRPSERALYE